MTCAVKYANYMSVDMDMFYKHHDHTKIVNSKSPIVAHG